MEFSELVGEFAALGAVIHGVSPDSVASHKKFAEKQGLKVGLLSDPEHKVLEAYGAWGPKKMYGREYFGVIRSSVLIDPEGVVQFAWPSAKSKGHAREVLGKLGELSWYTRCG